MTETPGTSYQMVEDNLRARITSGEFPPESAIPSTKKLERYYEVSDTVIKRAVGNLKEAKILRGQPGKGVFVRATPEQAVQQQADVDRLREEVTELSKRVEHASRDDLAERVGRLEAILIDLFARLGYEYPHDGAKAARRGRAAG